MTIQPVCSKLPSSVGVWEETNLPLSVVVTPLQAPLRANPPPIGSIAKCLSCGAPQPTTVTQYPLHHALLCHLCGQMSVTNYQDQLSNRPSDGMNDAVYNPKPTVASSSSSSSSSSTSTSTLDYTLPMLNSGQHAISAMACPPLWWIVLDGSTDSRLYWTKAAQTLSKLNIPPYVHLGLVVSSAQTLSVFNLQSAVPSVRHYGWKNPPPFLRFVPAQTAHLATALRALADVGPTTLHEPGHIPLIDTVQTLLGTLRTRCVHPGQDYGNGGSTLIPYAGARVMVLLSGAPEEIGASEIISSGQTMGGGGVGGRCSEEGLRFGSSRTEASVPDLVEQQDDPEMGGAGTAQSKTTMTEKAKEVQDLTDQTPSNLKHMYPKTRKDVEKLFNDLGIQCAEAAVGVDVLALSSLSTSTFSSVGVPFLRLLTERSGAPGPVLVDLDNTESLDKEVLSRTPWYRPCGFGGWLRLRLSQGFLVDTTAVLADKTETGPQLAPLTSNQGLSGPASPTKSGSLWYMGVCDDHQTVCIDLQVTNRIQHVGRMEGMGEVALKHGMQMSFAFTTITKDEETGNYYTRRILRVVSLHTPLVRHSEHLYASLNPSALAVVLFHKLASASYTESLLRTQDVARSWLKFVLVCAYKSAEDFFAQLKSRQEGGFTGRDIQFFPNERLLNGKGDNLTDTEILLCQGHDQLRLLPILVWGLMQSDALRPSYGSFRPTLDARSAAAGQMASMSPYVLSRCIIPSVELWASGRRAKEPIVEGLPLNMESIAIHLVDQQVDGNLTLFVDSPQQIFVSHSGYLRASNNSSPIEIGETLKTVIEKASREYRATPPIRYALNIDENMAPTWRDILVEDVPEVTANHTFEFWKEELAKEVQSEIMDEDY